MKKSKDIVTNCLSCHFAFMSDSCDRLYCPDCQTEMHEIALSEARLAGTDEESDEV